MRKEPAGSKSQSTWNLKLKSNHTARMQTGRPASVQLATKQWTKQDHGRVEKQESTIGSHFAQTYVSHAHISYGDPKV